MPILMLATSPSSTGLILTAGKFERYVVYVFFLAIFIAEQRKASIKGTVPSLGGKIRNIGRVEGEM
jgi:hypothetical protein